MDTLSNRNILIRVVGGIAVWVFHCVVRGIHFSGGVWAEHLLLFAVFVIFPLGYVQLFGRSMDFEKNKFANIAYAAAFFSGLFLMLRPWWAPHLHMWPFAVLWFQVTVLVAVSCIQRLSRHESPRPAIIALDSGGIFLAIGGTWVLFDFAGIRPLDFSPDIVLLTAVHFHYAGFALTILAGLAARRLGGRFADAVCIGVIAGVPLTALGITATQLQIGHWVETVAATWMALAGFGTAILYLKLIFVSGISRLSRVLWAIAALSLMFGMTLALLYGIRYLLPIPWLNIPWMRALHGSANAFGFAFCGLLGWSFLIISGEELEQSA